MIVQTRMSAVEYLQLPETTTPMELIDGELMISPAPLLSQQKIVYRLTKLIETLAGQGGDLYLAPVDVYLDEANVLQPDVLWLAPDSACIPVGGYARRGDPRWPGRSLRRCPGGAQFATC